MPLPPCYAVFHMNLAFSSIPTEDRGKVIDRCYGPMLDVAASGVPLGIPCSGWTLQEIERVRPQWMRRFSQLLKQGACELIGSGYVQLIGPLVPARVNDWNLDLGMACYEQLLGVRPKWALINEMAYSPSLLPLYKKHGFQGVVMERNNFETQTGASVSADTRLASADGVTMPVLWADSILFQKFQRLIHGDIHEAEYHEHLEKCLLRGEPLPIYCSDAEIFDFRPGRYHYEKQAHEGEWSRIEALFHQLKGRFPWKLPRDIPAANSKGPAVKTPDTRDPLPVKKQPKYNIARWSVTGRDDLKLNTLCHRLAQNPEDGPAFRKQLCELWSSDLRTHIGEPRFLEAIEALNGLLEKRKLDGGFARGLDPGSPISAKALKEKGIELEQDAIYLKLRTADLSLSLNIRRGLAIKELGFARNGFRPLAGTLPHGYFHAIRMGADFYSGGLIVELPGQLKRITDLERMEPQYFWNNGQLAIQGDLETSLGTFRKTLFYSLGEQKLGLRYDFPGWERPFGTVRVANLTLAPEAFSKKNLFVRCHNGGEDLLSFKVKPCNHGAAVSSLISCGAGFGATEGYLELADLENGLILEWDPAACAAFPMLIHQPDPPSHFTRLIFSLAEMDDTRKPGGAMPPFQFTLRPK